MRLPDTHVAGHLEKNESGVVELFMELDAIAILNLVVFLLFLSVLLLLCHLVLLLLKSKAKEAARVGTTNCWLQKRQILPMAKRVKMSLFDFSKRKCWLFSFLKQQIQRRTSLGPNSQRRRGPYGSEQGWARGICLLQKCKFDLLTFLD